MAEDRFQKGALPGIKQPGQKKVSTHEGEQAQTRFRPSPSQPPCYAVPPPSTPPAPPPGGEPSYTDLIRRIYEQHETFRQILVQLTGISKSIETAPKPENEYYNTPLTIIQVATANPPAGVTLDPTVISNLLAGTSGYQVEGIFTQLQRISPRVTVINDGTSTVYAITTPDGSNWSQESPILTGEARTLFNVWELRLRSPTAGSLTLGTGGIYRVTEYDFWLAYSSIVNKATFDARVVNAPAVGALLSDQLVGGRIDVPNGYSLALRATVGNTGQVYIGNSIANATNAAIPGNRITLNAGDSARLYIKNTDPVAIAGSAALQNLDILVEQ